MHQHVYIITRKINALNLVSQISPKCYNALSHPHFGLSCQLIHKT